MMFAILRAWASLQRSQWVEKKKLAKIRDAKLKRIVNHAYRNVPFYNKLYRSLRLDPEGIHDVSGLSRLPPITRTALQNASLNERTAVGTNLGACMLRATSGTTASPVQVYEDITSVAYRDAQNLRLLWAYGARPFHRVCRTCLGDSTGRRQKPRLSGVGLWGLLRSHGVKWITFETEPATALMLLSDWKPDIIFGSSSYLRLLVGYAEKMGITVNCKTAITSGEVLDTATRSRIREGFQAEVYDHYGMEEVGGSVAWECPTHSGYHVNDECVVLEYLRDGEPVAPGEPGEIHITSLTRSVTPMIRYATGDIAVPMEDECECGRSLSLMRDIQGRILDIVVTDNGRYISPVSIINRFQELQGLQQFKVFQNPDRTIDLHVTLAAGMQEPALKEVNQACSDLFGSTPTRIIEAEHVNHSLGHKFRIVESAFTNKMLDFNHQIQ